MENEPAIGVCREALGKKAGLYLTDGKARVLSEHDGVPQMTVHAFGKGLGVYLSGFACTAEGNRMLLDILLYAAGQTETALYLSDDARVEAAFYPASSTLAVVNNAEETVSAHIRLPGDSLAVTLAPMETRFIELA